AESCSSASKACASSFRVCALRAFITFGRLTVTKAMPSCGSTRMFSYAMALLGLVRDLDDARLDDLLRLVGLVARVALDVDDLLDDVDAADELAERRVLPVEVRRALVHHE